MMLLRFRSNSVDDADRLLLQRIGEQDATAMEELHRRYYHRVAHYVLRITRRTELVEEVVNDVMFAIWKGAGRFQGRSKVSTWVLGIGYRQSLKALARERRALPSADTHQLDRALAGEDKRLTQMDLQLMLRAALDSLSPAHRTVVELTYFYGHSYPEIAEIVGCPTNTVKTRMFHARRRLRKILENSGFARLGSAQESST